MKKLRVDVWSDVVCPWCYIGKRRLEGALARFTHKDDVEVVWRAFELDQGAPKVMEGDLVARLAKKYGRSRAQIEEMTRHITALAAAEGLAFDLEHSRPGNTFDAHRVIHLGSERGLQDAVKERLFRGYMTERESIGDHGVLARLAADAGLDPEEVRGVLASERYAREVREEEAAAQQIGITGVPFFVVGGKYGISGAQPADALLGALEEGWKDAESAAAARAEGAACGPDGCG